MTIPSVDWSKFDKYPRPEVQCHCGAVYMSHHKLVRVEGGHIASVTRTACPSCGESVDHVQRVSSGPERMTIGGES
jgi:ribosomal protein S27AE